MALPTFTRKAITAALRHSAEVAAGWLVEMRDDISTRLVALEGAAGGSDLSTAPVANFPAMLANNPHPGIIVTHCHVSRTFSGAFIRLTDGILLHDTNYVVFEIYELAPSGSPTGAWLAQGTSKITGGMSGLSNAFELCQIPLTSGPFTIGAGNSAQATFAMVGAGRAVPIGTVGLIPSA